MAIDSHMHINSLLIPKYYSKIEDSIDEINKDNSLSHVVNVGLDIDTSRECIAISKKNPKFYNSVGIHPLYVEKGMDFEEIRSMVDNKTVAIGEIGLDDKKSNFVIQKEAFIKQLIIANELGLPVIIHSNNSSKDIFKIFDEIIAPEFGCVFHCFQPELSSLDYLVKHGYYTSFAGRVTYNNAINSFEVLKEVPDELLMVETDSPYISPEPVRNEVGKSSYINYIIDRISLYKGTNSQHIEEITTNNTKKLMYKLK